MFTPINYLIAILWIISAVVDYADFCYIWQLKEYRWDRFKDFVSIQQGKAYWVKYRLLWRSMLAIIIFFWPINDTLAIKYILILLFAVDLAYNVYKLFRRNLTRPDWTKKAVLIILSSMFLEGILFIITRDWTLFLVLLIVRFFILSLVVLIINQPTKMLKRMIIKQATDKIKQHPKITVIGVTGSYGKTTVKKFITHMLSSKFSVVSTPGNINTEIGVAKYILKTDFTNKDIFVVEMGAYTTGEIKLICDIVSPKIGVLTAINEQHLSLFGDIKKTQEAKYELLNSLPQDGLAITNSDNEYCRGLLPSIKARVWTFGMQPEYKPACLVKSIKSNLNGTRCEFTFRGEEYDEETPLRGDYNAMNMIPAIMVSIHLGMNKEEVSSNIKTLPQTIKIFKYGKCDVIDDSYNSNPDGFKAALDFLNKFPSERKRVVITRGMLELGEKSEEIHEQIGTEISFMADELIVISPDNKDALTKGKVEKYHLDILRRYKHEELLEYVKSLKTSDAVILLENRIPELVMQELKSKT